MALANLDEFKVMKAPTVQGSCKTTCMSAPLFQAGGIPSACGVALHSQGIGGHRRHCQGGQGKAVRLRRLYKAGAAQGRERRRRSLRDYEQRTKDMVMLCNSSQMRSEDQFWKCRVHWLAGEVSCRALIAASHFTNPQGSAAVENTRESLTR
jgi:hypothetical protein